MDLAIPLGFQKGFQKVLIYMVAEVNLCAYEGGRGNAARQVSKDRCPVWVTYSLKSLVYPSGLKLSGIIISRALDK